MPTAFLDHSRPIAFAHRGGAAHAPENSWRAFEHAAEATVATLRARWRKTLDAVCDWAWEAVVEPLLKAAAGSGETGTAETGPPRVVLPAFEMASFPPV